MSLKRSQAGGRTTFGAGGETGAKVDRQGLFDSLKRWSSEGGSFTPVDVALAIGAGEPQVSKALLGLAADGFLEKMDVGRYRSTPMVEMTMAEFIKAFGRASKVDSTRQRDLSEILRLKQNNDTMRQRLLAAIAERDHYLAALKRHGIDPGPPPAPVATPAAPAPAEPTARLTQASAPALAAADAPPGPEGIAVPSPPSENAPSGPGDAGGHQPGGA